MTIPSSIGSIPSSIGSASATSSRQDPVIVITVYKSTVYLSLAVDYLRQRFIHLTKVCHASAMLPVLGAGVINKTPTEGSVRLGHFGSTCQGEIRALDQLVTGVGERPLRGAGPEGPIGTWRNRGSRVWGPKCVQRLKAKGCLKDLEKVVQWD